MKIGLSLYSLSRAVQAKEMSVPDAIVWIADHGGQHVEIVPIGFSLTDTPELIEAIRKKAEEVGIEVSNYAVGANFLVEDEYAFEREIRRVFREVDIAYELGVKLMRHDVAMQREDTSIKRFQQDLPKLAEACRRVADYAAQYGISTSVENHGYYVQASDRVQTLIHAVDRPNFKTTLDIGNFMCVDEDPVSAVKNNLSFASIVHIKDFYRRPSYRDPGTGWFRSACGNFLRGAISGHGDVDLWEILRVVKESGYDGYLSVEFEGMEDCRLGSKIGLENVKRIWNEV